MAESTRPQEGDAEARTCNVCHLPYTGDECPHCRAEREQAMGVVQQRGRRHHENSMDED